MAREVCELPTPIVAAFPVNRSWDLRAMVPRGKRPVVRLVSAVGSGGVNIDYELGWESQVANLARVAGTQEVPIYAGSTNGAIAPNSFAAAGLDSMPLRAMRDLDDDWMHFYMRASGPPTGAVLIWVGWEDFEGDDFVKVR